MKTLVLDYSTWRCGGDGPNSLGRGETLLRNNENFYCCLGQITPQLNKNIEPCDLLGLSTPSLLYEKVPLLSRGLNFDGARGIVETKLTSNAIGINDNIRTTVEQKIVSLRKLFGAKGYKIRVINRPK
jgi:hypothetical protein